MAKRMHPSSRIDMIASDNADLSSVESEQLRETSFDQFRHAVDKITRQYFRENLRQHDQAEQHYAALNYFLRSAKSIDDLMLLTDLFPHLDELRQSDRPWFQCRAYVGYTLAVERVDMASVKMMIMLLCFEQMQHLPRGMENYNDMYRAHLNAVRRLNDNVVSVFDMERWIRETFNHTESLVTQWHWFLFRKETLLRFLDHQKAKIDSDQSHWFVRFMGFFGVSIYNKRACETKNERISFYRDQVEQTRSINELVNVVQQIEEDSALMKLQRRQFTFHLGRAWLWLWKAKTAFHRDLHSLIAHTNKAVEQWRNMTRKSIKKRGYDYHKSSFIPDINAFYQRIEEHNNRLLVDSQPVSTRANVVLPGAEVATQDSLTGQQKKWRRLKKRLQQKAQAHRQTKQRVNCFRKSIYKIVEEYFRVGMPDGRGLFAGEGAAGFTRDIRVRAYRAPLDVLQEIGRLCRSAPAYCFYKQRPWYILSSSFSQEESVYSKRKALLESDTPYINAHRRLFVQRESRSFSVPQRKFELLQLLLLELDEADPNLTSHYQSCLHSLSRIISEQQLQQWITATFFSVSSPVAKVHLYAVLRDHISQVLRHSAQTIEKQMNSPIVKVLAFFGVHIFNLKNCEKKLEGLKERLQYISQITQKERVNPDDFFQTVKDWSQEDSLQLLHRRNVSIFTNRLFKKPAKTATAKRFAQFQQRENAFRSQLSG